MQHFKDIKSTVIYDDSEHFETECTLRTMSDLLTNARYQEYWFSFYVDSMPPRRKITHAKRNFASYGSVAGIYGIANTKTQTFYIGESIDIARRWMHHLHSIYHQNHENKGIRMHSRSTFVSEWKFTVLHTESDNNKRKKLEQGFIKHFDKSGHALYNRTKI